MSDAATPMTGEAHCALRISFRERLAGDKAAHRVFRDPYPRSAVGETIELEQLFAEAAGYPPPTESFLCLLLPSGAATPVDLQRRAEDWMNAPELSAEFPLADLVVQSDRILWRAGRAIVIGSPRRFDEVLAGLVDFSFYEAELRKLEHELDADWATAEADVPLTHSVDAEALYRRPHVDQMTRRMALRRIRFARLSPRLEKASVTLAGPIRRLVYELAQQAEIVDRLHSVDDRLEVFEDLYELANDRLGEFGYFQKENRLETWILAVLFLEVAIMLFEIWFAWWLDGA
jgi:hypothetical protein